MHTCRLPRTGDTLHRHDLRPKIRAQIGQLRRTPALVVRPPVGLLHPRPWPVFEVRPPLSSPMRRIPPLALWLVPACRSSLPTVCGARTGTDIASACQSLRSIGAGGGGGPPGGRPGGPRTPGVAPGASTGPSVFQTDGGCAASRAANMGWLLDLCNRFQCYYN